MACPKGCLLLFAVFTKSLFSSLQAVDVLSSDSSKSFSKSVQVCWDLSFSFENENRIRVCVNIAVCRLVAGDRSWHNNSHRSVKIALALESPIGDFNLLRYIHRSVIPITSPWRRPVLLGSAESEHPKLTVKLFSKNSNLCHHNPSTSQTDRRTDRQHVIPRPRFTLKCIAR